MLSGVKFGVKIGGFYASFAMSEMIIKQGEKLLYMLASASRKVRESLIDSQKSVTAGGKTP